MHTSIARPMSVVLMVLGMLSADLLATCGGGGGGGTGGMSGGSMGREEVFPVPWKGVQPEAPLPPGGLVVYWFPLSQNEFEKSSLRNSRALSLYATQCVTMGVADSQAALGRKFLVDEKPPVVVLAQTDGIVIGKAQGKDGFLRVGEVEKLVSTEMKARETSVKEKLKEAKEVAKGGDKDGAVTRYRAVLEQKCLFPKQAKDAANELKKLGVTDVGDLFAFAPIFDPGVGARIEKALRQGVAAENDSKYLDAEKLYSAAHQMDPADPAPMRYLGELYRHHIGDWIKARDVFNDILTMPADPLSRAVALHGLGKMTIHDGEFKKGLALMEDSVKEFPLALAYRNLSVYWNSERDIAKADQYTKLALALDPRDPFNLIFAAAFMAGNGHGDEALAVAREHEALLSASYNLAAVYAQLGQKEKALTLLKRHFFEYERYQAVRAKEMMEARVDAVFASLFEDAEFVTLTAGADGMQQAMPRR